ncbi:hypothetical protein [Neorhizobium sp. JUb45]|uniref:hypothetical protein n=1 Tax=unclassified Neorhizobium TaxID=2629175 RepID=UPI0010E94C8C|nr:hypothetical protein [Neorhizobium sp. JUb45]TCR03050.1 hypothetical protein EDF70_103477 [Neorhizobium sp. JUb45]
MALADRIAKFEQTNQVAFGIIEAEAAAREQKTEKLRQARLMQTRKSDNDD